MLQILLVPILSCWESSLLKFCVYLLIGLIFFIKIFNLFNFAPILEPLEHIRQHLTSPMFSLLGIIYYVG